MLDTEQNTINCSVILLSEMNEPSGSMKYATSHRICMSNLYILLQFYLQAACFHHLTQL